MFYPKTTTFSYLPVNFACTNYLINWEKVSDFMMDISKYVLTAVIITSAFEELSDLGWVMYVVGVAGAAILFLFSILVMKFINTKE